MENDAYAEEKDWASLLALSKNSSPVFKAGELIAETTELQQTFLDQAAGFVAEDIRSVRVNGEIVITALSKSTVGNVASVGYRVLRVQTEKVTLIELLDRAGTVLTTSAVQVPIVEEAVAFRHAFIVKEED